MQEIKAACLVFPHQLSRNHPLVDSGRLVILVEEWLFFQQYRFHRAKLVLHRASMKAYEDWLRGRGIPVRYVESSDPTSDCRQLVAVLSKEGIKELSMADVVDDWLRRRMSAACERHGIHLKTEATPNFLNDSGQLADYFGNKGRFLQNDFYVRQRKERGLLLDAGGGPLGGKWSFDADNRKKFPRGAVAPELPLPMDDEYVAAARKYVAKHFPEAYGEEDGPCVFGVTFSAADAWLDSFVETRLEGFGPYEDAISHRHPFLFHSVLTPMLNIGLLDPSAVIDKVLARADRRKIPLASLEGFIRQILGWREFVHGVYENKGRFQRTRNYWGFSRRIPASFWTGETGIGPVDRVIRKVLKYGYCHHIERLMVLGNFMLLCEFDPDEVYRWFMELFIDAYDWVMVPNVYGMTQSADGGLMTTKPYISGSNYLLKMGDFERGEWERTWDGLFWRFMDVHRDFFGRNPRLAMLLGTLDKMPAQKRVEHRRVAEEFLLGLDNC